MTQGVKTAVEAITSNPVQTRSDLVSLLLSLLQPLLSAQSPGGARISLSGTGAGFDQPAAELEGFARALWGLAPLLALQPDHPDFRSIREIWVAGLDAGTDPDNEEYWGNPGHRDQRYVEMGAIVSRRTDSSDRILTVGVLDCSSSKGVLVLTEREDKIECYSLAP